MKKETYEIRCATGTEKVNGYTFTTGKHLFGVTNEVRGRVVKNYWRVTELTSGLLASSASTKTMNAAIDDIINLLIRFPGFDELVKGAVEKYGRLNEGITPDRVIVSAKFPC